MAGIQTYLTFYACPINLQVWWWSDQKYRRDRVHNIYFGAQGQVTPKSMDGYGWNLNSSKTLYLGYL